MEIYKYIWEIESEEVAGGDFADFTDCLIGYFADVDHPHIYV